MWLRACLDWEKKTYKPTLHGLLRNVIPVQNRRHRYRRSFQNLSKLIWIHISLDLFTNCVEASETADSIFKLIIKRHGCPTRNFSDQGTQFTSKLFHQLKKRKIAVLSLASAKQCKGRAFYTIFDQFCIFSDK